MGEQPLLTRREARVQRSGDECSARPEAFPCKLLALLLLTTWTCGQDVELLARLRWCMQEQACLKRVGTRCGDRVRYTSTTRLYLLREYRKWSREA